VYKKFLSDRLRKREGERGGERGRERERGGEREVWMVADLHW
jgi:hypothetical protein